LAYLLLDSPARRVNSRRLGAGEKGRFRAGRQVQPVSSSPRLSPARRVVGPTYGGLSVNSGRHPFLGYYAIEREGEPRQQPFSLWGPYIGEAEERRVRTRDLLLLPSPVRRHLAAMPAHCRRLTPFQVLREA
jgi:hypothetical protein